MPPTGPGGGGLWIICPTLRQLEGITTPDSRWYIVKLLRLALFKNDDGDVSGLPPPYNTVNVQASWIAEEAGLLNPGDQLYAYFKASIDTGWFGKETNWWTPAEGAIDGGKAEISALKALERAFSNSLGLFGPPNYDPSSPEWVWPALSEGSSGSPDTKLKSTVDLTAMPGYFQTAHINCYWAAVSDTFQAIAGGRDVLFLTPGMNLGVVGGLSTSAAIPIIPKL